MGRRVSNFHQASQQTLNEQLLGSRTSKHTAVHQTRKTLWSHRADTLVGEIGNEQMHP